MSALCLSAFFLNNFSAYPARAQSNGCQEGRQPGGALYRVCLPPGQWNGDLVLYAHGYVPAGGRPALPGEASSLMYSLMPQGFAFATTSYRTNGLAVLPAVDDLLELVQIFREKYGEPRRVFLIGFSEGGLIATLAVERHPDVFAGGLAMCGPAGSFQEQVNYFGDFRVVFDALFPGVIPGDPINISAEVSRNWEQIYREKVIPTLSDPANAAKVRELMRITGAAFDPDNPYTVESTARGALGYNIFATNDAREQLGGNPFDNQGRRYSGSADDERLNREVVRIQADPRAAREIEAYESSGDLRVPMVAMHTTGDEIVPFAQMEIYREKVRAAGREALLETITVERYGHCGFTGEEINAAFERLVGMADAHPAASDLEAAPAEAVPQIAATGTPTWAAEQDQTLQSGPAVEETVSVTTVAQPTPGSEMGQPPEGGPLGRFWGWLVQTVRGLVK